MIRKSAAQASDMPPPAATPLTAAMTGLGICQTGSTQRAQRAFQGGRCPALEISAGMRLLTSAPVQNPRPVPVITTTLTRGIGARGGAQLRQASR